MSLEADTTQIKKIVEAGLFKPATPEQIAARSSSQRFEPQDFTDRLGQLGTDCEWPMYSFERISHMFWNGFANAIGAEGYNLDQIKDILQSKMMRWLLDSEDGKVEAFGKSMGQEFCRHGREGILRFVERERG